MSNRYLYRKNNEKSEIKDVGLPSNMDDLVALLD
jgi:hypothetical protein